MAQLFRPGADSVARCVLIAIGVMPFLFIAVSYAIVLSPPVTGQNITLTQPVPFSHEHHVGGLGLDCRYCHTGVETSAFAGLPATETCMTCHSQIWTQAEMLAPVRESLANGAPIRWQRVNRLPDYVYFDHSVHLAKGVGCTTCHGSVDEMPLMRQSAPLTMAMVPRLPSQPRSEFASAPRRFLPQTGSRPTIRRSEASALARERIDVDASCRLFGVPPVNRPADRAGNIAPRGAAASCCTDGACGRGVQQASRRDRPLCAHAGASRARHAPALRDDACRLRAMGAASSAPRSKGGPSSSRAIRCTPRALARPMFSPKPPYSHFTIPTARRSSGMPARSAIGRPSNRAASAA